MTATERLRQLLDERGVRWEPCCKVYIDTQTFCRGYTFTEFFDGLMVTGLTPEQAVEATLGAIPRPNPTWERWLKSLKHDEVKTIGDAVEQLMYEAIEFGGDMGPNGNVYNGIDEGDVLTAGFINEWVEKFDATLGRGTCKDVCNSVSEFTCSACGFNCDLTSWISLFDGDEGRHRHHHHGTPNYCPNCGRVVKE